MCDTILNEINDRTWHLPLTINFSFVVVVVQRSKKIQQKRWKTLMNMKREVYIKNSLHNFCIFTAEFKHKKASFLSPICVIIWSRRFEIKEK